MSEYVTNESWVRTLARPDAIDDVADQFERPAAQPAQAPPITRAANADSARWPRSARGWRSQGRLHPRPAGDLFADS